MRGNEQEERKPKAGKDPRKQEEDCTAAAAYVGQTAVIAATYRHMGIMVGCRTPKS